MSFTSLPAAQKLCPSLKLVSDKSSDIVLFFFFFLFLLWYSQQILRSWHRTCHSRTNWGGRSWARQYSMVQTHLCVDLLNMDMYTYCKLNLYLLIIQYLRVLYFLFLPLPFLVKHINFQIIDLDSLLSCFPINKHGIYYYCYFLYAFIVKSPGCLFRRCMCTFYIEIVVWR